MPSSPPPRNTSSPSSTGFDKNLNSTREGKEMMSLSVAHPTNLFRLRERDCKELKHAFPVPLASSPEKSVWSSPLPLRLSVVRLKTQTWNTDPHWICKDCNLKSCQSYASTRQMCVVTGLHVKRESTTSLQTGPTTQQLSTLVRQLAS